MYLIKYMSIKRPLIEITNCLPLFNGYGELITHLRVDVTFKHLQYEYPTFRNLFGWIDIELLTEKLLDECISDFKKSMEIYGKCEDVKIKLTLSAGRDLKDFSRLFK